MSSSRKFTKHKKKYWRKGINTKDVEESITEHRRQELLRDLAASKKDEELFTLERNDQEQVAASKRKRRPLTSEYHCTNHSIITLPIQPHSIKRNNYTNDTGLSSSDDEIDIPKEHMCSHQNVTVAINVKKRGLSLLRNNLIETKPVDIWSNEATPTNTLPQRPSVRRKPFSNRSIANLELPHSGTSYNPAFTDHQNLLHQATQDEERKLEKYKKLCASIKMTPMNYIEREQQWLLEATEGLDERGEEDDSSDGDIAVVPKLIPKRKTRQQKRREMMHKQAAVNRKSLKLEKKRLHDVNRIKTIKKEIVASEKLRQENIQRRVLRKSIRKTFRVGKYKYEKPLIDVQLSSELCSSLRLLQGTGNNLMNDRYASLLKRNMIEPKGPPRPVKKSTIKKR